ncbi:hypothetical protein OGH69_12465 [Flavobacterium sp. MFBS3-15]|uniref:hypothetical protein n=1 Tax=Flavobacterium sp. MFBS3-15 TaxID=2989816 RepID=UPI0022367F9E|nr:hypothetical protein [Flavobacterium sp. MFBS3-15]MCW4469785.1 hypothetical protein [Flavobacterium sp. MFBS3-15]
MNINRKAKAIATLLHGAVVALVIGYNLRQTETASSTKQYVTEAFHYSYTQQSNLFRYSQILNDISINTNDVLTEHRQNIYHLNKLAGQLIATTERMSTVTKSEKKSDNLQMLRNFNTMIKERISKKDMQGLQAVASQANAYLLSFFEKENFKAREKSEQAIGQLDAFIKKKKMELVLVTIVATLVQSIILAMGRNTIAH